MLATFYVFYSTFRVVMKFLNSCVTTVWQSLNDFPRARKQITGFASDKGESVRGSPQQHTAQPYN